MSEQNAMFRPIRALLRKRWLALVLTIGCLIGLGIYSWIGLIPHASHATPTGNHAAASNTLLLFEETTDSTTIHITARSTHDGQAVWTKSQAYTHDDYVRRGNGLQYVVNGEVVATRIAVFTPPQAADDCLICSFMMFHTTSGA